MIKLPEISDFQNLIKSNLKNQEYVKRSNSINESAKKVVSTTILNTPLYRLYAENKRFETLNLIKPINFSQRKVVNIQDKTDSDLNYLTKVKDYMKEMSKIKETNNQYISNIEEIYNKKM